MIGQDIFPDSIGVKAYSLVLLRPFPIWSFHGARAASAALCAFLQSKAAASPINRNGLCCGADRAMGYSVIIAPGS
jgi:hypothetical protein